MCLLIGKVSACGISACSIEEQASPTAPPDGSAGQDFAPLVFSVAEDGVLFIDPLAMLQLPYRDLRYQEVAAPQHGRMEVAVSSPSYIRYVPAADFYGEDSFRYRILVTAEQELGQGEVRVTVEGRPDAPRALGGVLQVEAGPPTSIELPWANVDDPNAERTYHLFQLPQHGSLSGTSSGEYRYVPAADFVGEDRIVYGVRVGERISERPGIFILEVTNANDPPTAGALSVEAPLDAIPAPQVR